MRDDKWGKGYVLRRRAECHPDRQHHALGLCVTCYKRKRKGAKERVKRVPTCHPDKKHKAHGMCTLCYELWRHPPKNNPKRVALCHPERPHLAKGKCSECYWRDRYQNEPGFRDKVLKYQKDYRAKYGSASQAESSPMVEARSQ